MTATRWVGGQARWWDRWDGSALAPCSEWGHMNTTGWQRVVPSKSRHPKHLGCANIQPLRRTADGFATWPNFTAFPANTTASIGRYQLAPNQTTFVYPQIGYIQPLLLTKGQVGVINSEQWGQTAGRAREDGLTATQPLTQPSSLIANPPPRPWPQTSTSRSSPATSAAPSTTMTCATR